MAIHKHPLGILQIPTSNTQRVRELVLKLTCFQGQQFGQGNIWLSGLQGVLFDLDGRAPGGLGCAYQFILKRIGIPGS